MSPCVASLWVNVRSPPFPLRNGNTTTTNFDPFFLNRRFQRQAPRAKVERLAHLLHVEKVPFQVGKAAVLTKVFCGVSSGTPGKRQDNTPKLYQECILTRRPSGRLVWNAHSDTKHKIEFSSVRGGRFGITCSNSKGRLFEFPSHEGHCKEIFA
jgi:hypothetical protein